MSGLEVIEMETPTFQFALRADLENDKRFLPTRMEPYATGYDIRACQVDRKDITLRAGQFFRIPCGFRAFPPEGWWFELHPRSSSFAKKSMHCLIGIIDEHYANELMICGQYIPDVNALGRDLVIKYGDPVGQIIPKKRIEMNVVEITNTVFEDMCSKRKSFRTGGIGSTG
jgi:dUTPase